MNQVEELAAVNAAPEIKTSHSLGWQAVLLTALVAVLYYKILWNLAIHWWQDPNFSHGFFVPLFSGWILWANRKKLAQLPVRPSWSGLVLIALSLAMLVVGVLGSELFLQRVSLISLLAGLVVYMLGWTYYRAVFFAWAFLLFMIPIPAILFNQVTFPLQLLASQVASTLLPLFGVPILREGNVLHLPAMPLEVAEACSGIRSLMSLGTLAIVYGYFLEPRTWARVALAIAAIPIAVAANASRIVGTGLLVQYWDPDKALGFFHEFSGLVIFVVSFALLIAVHKAEQLVTPGGKNAL